MSEEINLSEALDDLAGTLVMDALTVGSTDWVRLRCTGARIRLCLGKPCYRNSPCPVVSSVDRPAFCNVATLWETSCTAIRNLESNAMRALQ